MFRCSQISFTLDVNLKMAILINDRKDVNNLAVIKFVRLSVLLNLYSIFKASKAEYTHVNRNILNVLYK